MKQTLTARQIEAIKALIKYPTVKEAAEASGTPIRTLERWLTQPEFLDALHQVQKESFKEAGSKIISSMTEAAESITDVMRNPTHPGANMKLKAASMLMEQGAKYHKAIVEDERLKRLEEKAGIDEATRIAKIEEYFNKKIVDDYMHSAEYNPIASLSQVQVDLFDRITARDPSKINLLTPVERVKYDKHYRDKLRAEQIEEEQMKIYLKEIEDKSNGKKKNTRAKNE